MKKFIFLSLYSVFILNSSYAQDSTNIRTVASWNFGNFSSCDYTVINGHNYLVVGLNNIGTGVEYSTKGIQIFNVDNPLKPAAMSTFSIPSYAISAIKIVGNICYITNFEIGLQIVDISDPFNPILISTFNIPGGGSVGVRGLDVSNGYAYIANYDYGIRIIDVHDPSNPYEVGFYNTPGYVWDVTVHGDLVYIADWYTGGVRIVNIATPSTPYEVGYYITPGYSKCIAIDQDTLAYVADDTRGIRVLNVSNPTSPFEICYYDSIYAEKLIIIDSLLYAKSGFGYRIFNITDPHNIQLLCSRSTSDYTNDIAVSGDILYDVKMWSVNVWNISDASNPALISHYWPPHYDSYVNSYSGHIFFTEQISGLRILNSNPSMFYEIGSYDTVNVGLGPKAAAIDSILFLQYWFGTFPAWQNSLLFMNIGNANNLKAIGHLDYQWDLISDISSRQNYLYTLSSGYYDHINRLRIADVSNLIAPIFVGSIILPAIGKGITVSDNIIYIANDTMGLKLVNVSDPSNPYFTGGIAINKKAVDVVVKNPYAFIATDSFGLRIIDISDTSNLFEVAHLDLPGQAIQLSMSDTIIYIICANNSVRAVNISNPLSPVEIGHYNIPCGIYDMTTLNNRVIVTDEYYGLRAFELFNISGITEYSHNDRGESPDKVWCNGKYLFYNLLNSDYVKIKLYNTLGQQVSLLENGPKKVGLHKIYLSNISSGIYFVRMETSGKAYNRKIVYLK